MGLLSDKINDWVEGRIEVWRERLRGWSVAVLSLAAESVLHAIEKAAAPHLKPIIERMEAAGGLPDELKPLFKELKEPAGAWPAMMAMAGGGAMMGGALGAIGDAIFGSLARNMMSLTTTKILDALPLIILFRRKQIDSDFFYSHMAELGYDQVWADHFVTSMQEFPNLADVVRFYAKEAFEPDMIDRYGLDDEMPPYQGTLFEKLGVPEDTARLFWISHWDHASYGQVIEMLRRGLLTLDKKTPEPPTTKEGWAARDKQGIEALYQYYRVVEIPPFWRDRLTAQAWNVPTRVDVRRWWDMRTIDESELYSIYHRQGYHGKDLDNYVRWTKVYTDFPVMIARWRNGWINEQDVRDWLKGLDIPEDRIEQFIQEKVKPEESARVEDGRDLTKTDIIKGVKTEQITRDMAVDLLMDINYSEDEAVFLLDVNIPEDEQVSKVKARQLTKSDILSGLKAETITEAQAITKLTELRYNPADAQFILDIFKASAKPPVEPRDKEASKADIVLGVKKGLITPEEGYLMLIDVGYSADAANFILTVRVEESPFSPINYSEFKALTSKYRRATGREVKAMPEELKKAADELVKATKERDEIKGRIMDLERSLLIGGILSDEATKEQTELQAALRNAEAEIARVQSDYDRLKAQYKFSG